MEPPRKKLKYVLLNLIEEIDNSTVVACMSWMNTWMFPNYNYLYALHRDDHIRFPGFFEIWIDRYLDSDFRGHFRMKRQTFNLLLQEITPYYLKRANNPPVKVEKAVLATLWYLAKGEVLYSVGDRFNIAVSTTHTCVNYIVEIMNILLNKFVKWPTKDECFLIEKQFRKGGGFPGVIGAIDGCHFECKIPVSQQDSYQDRKFNHSIGVQAICTYKLLFTNISVGYPGSLHDGRILKESNIHRKITTQGVMETFYDYKYHLLGDSAYPCKTWLMTPYKDYGTLDRYNRTFNYIHSKTRVKIENSFAQVKGRWRITQFINAYSVKKCCQIVSACFFLHNFCVINSDDFKGEEVQTIRNRESIVINDEEDGLFKREIICKFLNQV